MMTDGIEVYLDRLFDLLAGTGARGRRVLIEAQTHLEEAVERGVASGLSQADAERVAIRRFGSPEDIASAHAEACTLTFAAAIGRVFAAGWMMSGVAGLAVGLMGVFALILAQMVGPTFVSEDSTNVVQQVDELVTRSLRVGAIALVLLGLFALARRTPSLRAFTRLPSTAMVSTAGAVAFGGVGLLLFGYGVVGFALGERVEVGVHLAEGLAGVVAGLVFLPHAWRQVTTADALSTT